MAKRRRQPNKHARMVYLAVAVVLNWPQPVWARTPDIMPFDGNGALILWSAFGIAALVALIITIGRASSQPSHRATMEILARIQGRYIERFEERGFLDDMLQDLLKLTHSEYGVLRVGVGSTLIFTEELRAVGWRGGIEPTGQDASLPPLEAASARALDEGRPITDETTHNGKSMTVCAIPLAVGAERFGVIALANRPGGYSQRLLKVWDPVLNAVAHILHALHQRQIGDQARDALRHASRQQRLILDNMADAVLILSSDLTVTHANSVTSTLFGYTLHEITGHNGARLFDEREAVRPDGLGSTQLQNGQCRFLDQAAETQGLHKDGHAFPIEMQITRITQMNKPAYVLSIHDITKRRLDEQVLRQSEHETRAILDNMADTFYRTDLQGRIVIISKSVSGLLGVPPRQLLGKRMADLYADQGTRSRFFRELNARGGRISDFQVALLHNNGHTVWCAMNARYCRDSHGNVTGVEGTVRDITSRLEAEKALADNERKFRAIADYTFDWESWLDPMGHLIWVSNGVEPITGYSTQDCHAMDDYPLALVHPDDRLGVANALSTDHGSNHTFRILRRDGGELWGSLSWRTISDENDNPLGLRASIHDITDMRQAERHLIQQAKLATLGETAAGLAHELSQPLNIIRLAAEGTLLRMGSGPVNPEEQEHQLSVIESQAARMGEIIDHIRVFSRKDTEETSLFVPLDAVKGAVDLVEVQFKADNVTIEKQWGAPSDAIRGRQVQLEQVILNLLTNARDSIQEARQRGDRAEDETGVIRISVLNHGDKLSITVDDTGTGFPDQGLDQVFEPFFTTKEVGAGTGLGLSVSADIIASMSGTIFASNTDHGGRVEITLPLEVAPVSAHSQIARPIQDISGDGRHVLVVDDEPAAADALATFVESLGFRVSIGYDGAEAQEIFDADPADVVITDLRMPRCDGHELIARLRDKDVHVPIIVTTGHFEKTSMPEGIDGPDAVLRKPVSLRDLKDALGTLGT